MKGTPLVLTVFAAALTACGTDSPLPTSHASHAGMLKLSDVAQVADAATLAALRLLTANFHDVDAATAAQYGLLKAPPATAADGCISDASMGGMGYHYTRGDNLMDDSVTLLDPEFLVYAPTNAPAKNGEVRRRLAAFDYFIFYSAKWPGPNDANFKRAPTTHDFATMRALPDIAFAPSRFSGWMFHIWLWEHNPDGMFANWNTSVPRCAGSTF